MKDYLSDVFGDGGLFASRFPGYEMREGQVALARMVDEAMRGGHHTLGEGPCGTGKGVAYLVPASWHAHHAQKRVVIATANIALQEQLVRKDLPMLASVLPWPFTFALLKGRNNYACHDRMAESEARGELNNLFDDELQRQIVDVFAWTEATKSGDVSELSFIPAPQVWSRFSVGSDECKGKDCPFREDCFAERARDRALGADIVVTNYHLLFAHLAVREVTDQDLVLPAFDLLVLDEAHEAAEIARDFFGFSVSEHTFARLASAAADLGNKQLAGELRQEAQRLFTTLTDYARSPRYRRRLKEPWFTSSVGVQCALSKLVALAKDHAKDESYDEAERASARNVVKNASVAGERLAEGLAQADSGKVYWLDVDAKGRTKLRAKPIDVSELLHEELFARCPSVSLVSATLTTSGTFDFVRRELGVPEDALEVISPRRRSTSSHRRSSSCLNDCLIRASRSSSTRQRRSFSAWSMPATGAHWGSSLRIET